MRNDLGNFWDSRTKKKFFKGQFAFLQSHCLIIYSSF